MTLPITAAPLLLLAALFASVTPAEPPAPNPAATAPPPEIAAAVTQPNAALLYWRYWSMISDDAAERLRAAYSDDQRKDPAWAPDDEVASLAVELQDAVEGLLRAAAVERCDFGLEHELGLDMTLPHLGQVRSGARLLAIDARRLAAAGEHDAAAARVGAIFRSAAHIRSDHFAISSFVACALAQVAAGEAQHLIASGKLSGDARADLRAAAASLSGDDPFGFKESLRQDGQRWVSWISTVGYKLDPDDADPDEDPNDEDAAVRVKVERALAEWGVGAYDAAIAAWDDPDAVAKLASIEERAGSGEWGPVPTISMPPLVKARRSQTAVEEQLASVLDALNDEPKDQPEE